MEQYLRNYGSYEKSLIYSFSLGQGGVGDCIKFFIAVLNECIDTKKKIYYLITDAPVEEFIKLNYPQFYITKSRLVTLNNYEIREPTFYYNSFNYEQITIPINTIFHFSDIIIDNKKKLFPESINYYSIHVRLGDKYLETDKTFVLCKEDTRTYNNQKICEYIESLDGNVLLFSDNNEFKLRMKNKYKKIIILNSSIGHTSLSNTSRQQTIDTITEFYILTMSDNIAVNTKSGFSMMASKFNKIPVIELF